MSSLSSPPLLGDPPQTEGTTRYSLTPARLTQYLFNRQEGIADALNSEQDAHRLMEEMTARYGMFTGTQERAPVNGGAEGSRQQGLTIVSSLHPSSRFGS